MQKGLHLEILSRAFQEGDSIPVLVANCGRKPVALLLDRRPIRGVRVLQGTSDGKVFHGDKSGAICVIVTRPLLKPGRHSISATIAGGQDKPVNTTFKIAARPRLEEDGRP